MTTLEKVTDSFLIEMSMLLHDEKGLNDLKMNVRDELEIRRMYHMEAAISFLQSRGLIVDDSFPTNMFLSFMICPAAKGLVKFRIESEVSATHIGVRIFDGSNPDDEGLTAFYVSDIDYILHTMLI